ncbi:MAG: dicarboxylate/amino acid:cation symporter [Phycisphaerales bacterium]|nr:dicarboxylate/amino acid:cation symporter [Phycisphaerales bacterium]
MKIALHWRILIGLVLGLVVGMILNVAWNSGTWSSLGVNDVSAFMSGRNPWVVPEGESLASLGLTEADLVSRDASALQELGLRRANDPGAVALVARFLANLNEFAGDLFIRALRFIAVPLVLFSLIVGASSLNDIKKLGRIGGKTVLIYLTTTAVAVAVGLVFVNVIRPGSFVNEETRNQLVQLGSADAEAKLGQAASNRGQADASAWDKIVDLIPQNPMAALSNAQMLQIVFTALIIGIGLTLIRQEKAAPVIAVCDGMTEVIIKLVNVGMMAAPIAVFALIAKVAATIGLDVLGALAVYTVTVLAGLGVMIFGMYPLVLRVLTPVRYARFFKGVAPAQLLAFSSSSSAATLPVTMECCEERLGVSEEVSSFALPLGATINMDGTALYQGVAAVFIVQILGIELTMFQQLSIILTATLASIGTAAVPSAGLIMLVIVLEQLKMGPQIAPGIAILFGVDRLLDMCRTTCNVTGDCMVATVVASSEGELLTEEDVAKRAAHPIDEWP